jgi:transposase
MLGKQRYERDLFCYIQLENMVPQDHILRKIKDEIDFSFIDKLAEPLYSDKGRPSVVPQVLVRMLLIGYLFGINKERRLCQEVHLNIAYRWFCDLSLEDKVPDHSTFSKNRHGRFQGTNLFREMFYQIVEQAIAKGLVRGKHLSTDATLIAADAAMSSLEEIVPPLDPENYWKNLEAESKTPGKEVEQKKSRKSINQTHSSKTDPDAQVASRWGSKKKLSYSDNILMDNESRVIIDVEVTSPSGTEEAVSSVDMVKRSLFRYDFNTEDVGADSAYSRGEAVNGFREAGIKIYAPAMRNVPDSGKGIFGKEKFIESEDGCLICPNGKNLNRVIDKSKPRLLKYFSTIKKCHGCPLKEQCTKGAYRTVSVHIDQEALDWAENLRQSEGYAISQKMRKRIEHLFGEAKEQMGLRRASRRGIKNVEEQCLMTAMVQNIKRIVLAQPRSGGKALIFTYDYATLVIESLRIALNTFLNPRSNILLESLNQQEVIHGN